MNLDLYALIILTVLALFFAPYYFWLRNSMTLQTKKDKAISYYTKRRISHFFLLVMLALLLTFSFVLLMIAGIKLRSNGNIFSIKELVTLIAFTFCWMLMAAGIGLYISGVFIEQYTMVALKAMPEYSRLKIATKLLHGRISHICIFSGGMLSLLIICIFELFNAYYKLGITGYVLYAATGVVLGFIYYLSQIRNLTWRYQLPFFILFFWLEIIVLFISGLSLIYFPFNIFFLFFAGTSALGLFIHWLFKQLK